MSVICFVIVSKGKQLFLFILFPQTSFQNSSVRNKAAVGTKASALLWFDLASFPGVRDHVGCPQLNTFTGQFTRCASVFVWLLTSGPKVGLIHANRQLKGSYKVLLSDGTTYGERWNVGKKATGNSSGVHDNFNSK